MNRPAIILSALAALTLGACEVIAPYPAPPTHVTGRPRVDLFQETHAVAFEPGAEDPSPAERARLEDFLRRLRMDARDHVYLVTGTDELSLRRAAAVAADLAALGHPAETPRYAPLVEVPGNAVAVVVERAEMAMPACGDFPAPNLWNLAANLPSPNFGCATARNLAVHIHDPLDLVVGRRLDDASGEKAARAVEAYRLGRIKPLPDPNRTRIGGGSSK